MKLINLPNIITSCNVLCGCLAIAFGLQGEIGLAGIMILAGAFFDFFDGMTARALGISGPIGKELDSLADMVSFGIAPAVLAYQVALSFLDDAIWVYIIAAIIAIFSAMRLAKFNCDERQHLSFIGLPTPSNALFWIGLSNLVYVPSVNAWLNANATLSLCIWVALVVICSILLICELPMFSLKIKPGHNGFAENRARYIFLALVPVVLLLCLGGGFAWFTASPAFIILIYIIMSVIDVTVLTKK